MVVACGDPPDPDQAGSPGTIYMLQVCNQHDPDPRRSISPPRTGRRTETVVHPDALLRRWKRLVKVTGVPVIPLHGARHSYAELALSSGVRLDVVSRTLGHSSSAFTADQYRHDSDEAAAEAADRIGAPP